MQVVINRMIHGIVTLYDKHTHSENEHNAITESLKLCISQIC